MVITEQVQENSIQTEASKRVYIAKKNSNKKRLLGIQSGNDKLVQEVVKMILESIYEPVFSNKSHGFRPNRSCQTALMQIQKTFTGTNWFVEGDIHAYFDSFDHHVIVEILKKRIDDEMFIQLIWKFLKAGIIAQSRFPIGLFLSMVASIAFNSSSFHAEGILALLETAGIWIFSV